MLFRSAVISLRPAANRATWTRHIETGKTAANLLGRNLAAQLQPTAQDLTMYGVTAMNASSIPSAAKSRLDNLGRALITAKKAFALGLTNSIMMGLSPGATSEQFFTDPHAAHDDLTNLQKTLSFMGQMLTAFYADLDSTADPACSAKTLGQTTILTVHGDTPHTPLQRNAWPEIGRAHV